MKNTFLNTISSIISIASIIIPLIINKLNYLIKNFFKKYTYISLIIIRIWLATLPFFIYVFIFFLMNSNKKMQNILFKNNYVLNLTVIIFVSLILFMFFYFFKKKILTKNRKKYFCINKSIKNGKKISLEKINDALYKLKDKKEPNKFIIVSPLFDRDKFNFYEENDYFKTNYSTKELLSRLNNKNYKHLLLSAFIVSLLNYYIYFLYLNHYTQFYIPILIIIFILIIDS